MSAVTLALITGCSSEESDGSKSTDAGNSSASPTQAAKALSAAELEKLLLAQGDLDAKKYKIEDGDDTLPKSRTTVKSTKAECEPLVWATAALPPGDTDAHASNTVSEVPTSTGTSSPEDFADAFDINVTFVGLSSYEGDGAEKAMKAVSDGASACTAGYEFTGDGETTKVNKVAPAQGSGQGDESVAFSQEIDMDGAGPANFTTEVVRKGNTIATFYTLNLASIDSGKAPENPTEVVTAQLGKIK